MATRKAVARALCCPMALGFNKGHEVMKSVSKSRHSVTSHTKFAVGMIREMYDYALQAVGHRVAQDFQGQVLKFKEKAGMRICPESKGETLSNGKGLWPRKMNT